MDIDAVRSRFPALNKTDTVYADNAGGTQVLGSVAEYIHDYLISHNVQLGGLYSLSTSSGAAVSAGLAAGAAYINAASPDEVVFGPSTTQLFTNLSLALQCAPGDELVVSEADHEANIAPWHRLAALRGLTVVPWRVRESDAALHLDDLASLLNDKTQLVTVTHCSNLLGAIHPIREIGSLVRERTRGKAQVCVDGVAFAPHRQVDVAALGVDFYCFSWYKVYGPHLAMLYASTEAQKRLDSLGHYFHTGTDLATKLGLAGAAYELQASVPTVVQYLRDLGAARPGRGAKVEDVADRAALQMELRKSFDLIAVHEEELSRVILSYLTSRSDLYRVFGPTSWSREARVPLVTFACLNRRQSDVVAAVHARSKIGIRNGHMYSKRLMDHLGAANEGEYAIRISLVHYNSIGEAEAFVALLKEIVE